MAIGRDLGCAACSTLSGSTPVPGVPVVLFDHQHPCQASHGCQCSSPVWSDMPTSAATYRMRRLHSATKVGAAAMRGLACTEYVGSRPPNCECFSTACRR